MMPAGEPIACGLTSYDGSPTPGRAAGDSALNRNTAVLSLLLTLGMPGLALADDEFEDLEVTMEVLGSEAELDILINQMRGPSRSDAARDRIREVEFAEDAQRFEDLEAGEDGFYDDDLFRNDPLLEEDDFESLEGEDLDLDIPEVPEPESIDPMEE